MQKEKIILLNTFAELVRELIPTGKAPTKLAMEYDMAKSEISYILHAKKDFKFTTFILVAEMLEIDFDELAKQLKSRLPEDFRLSEM